MSTLYSSDDKANRLITLVRNEIKINPFEYDGHTWAARPLAWWAEQLGVCERHVRRIIKESGLHTDRATIDRKQVRLLRDGAKGYSQKQQAVLLTKILEKHVGRPHTPYEFGVCYGLVETWGASAPDIFKIVLKYPVPFINCARGDPKCTYHRFINTFDSYLRFLRSFAHCAPEFAEDVKTGAFKLGYSDQVKVHETPYWQTG